MTFVRACGVADVAPGQALQVDLADQRLTAIDSGTPTAGMANLTTLRWSRYLPTTARLGAAARAPRRSILESTGRTSAGAPLPTRVRPVSLPLSTKAIRISFQRSSGSSRSSGTP